MLLKKFIFYNILTIIFLVALRSYFCGNKIKIKIIFKFLNNFNVLLENYGLNNFQHRLFIRMATFIHNIVNIITLQSLIFV